MSTLRTPHERPDVILIMTDQERAAPSYEPPELTAWRSRLAGRRWFDEHAVSFASHYTGSLACVPSRPTIFTGQYPDVHGVTQTDGLGKDADDSRLRWLPEGEVPTLGHWFRAAGYDTHYDGKWHISHADLIDETTGGSLATNDDDGVIDHDAVQTYLDADPLDPYGFTGWVGPEPHGALLANSGTRRDPLIAARVVAWLEDRYERRAAGDADALRPFLLVASFVNPHDIVLFPGWMRRGGPIEPGPADPPSVGPSPTDDEDLSTKPSAQAAYRASYPTGYGPHDAIAEIYTDNAQWYRDLYYRLHDEVDGPIDRVRRAVTGNALIARTSDHGELLGAHGGLHQKWFNLYDEATRIPFQIARVGANATTGRAVTDALTSHIDIVPTLLAAAGIEVDAVTPELRDRFSEVHPLPGRNLMPVVDGVAEPDELRTVYLMTRDNILEGDTGASAIGRALGLGAEPPPDLRVQVPADVAANFEGVVGVVSDHEAPGGGGHRWKLTRTFDDPATWTEPNVRHLASSVPGHEHDRTAALPDEWELYDLTVDPIEHHNRSTDPAARAVFDHLCDRLASERARCIPERNQPWPYTTRPTPEWATV